MILRSCYSTIAHCGETTLQMSNFTKRSTILRLLCILFYDSALFAPAYVAIKPRLYCRRLLVDREDFYTAATGDALV